MGQTFKKDDVKLQKVSEIIDTHIDFLLIFYDSIVTVPHVRHS